VLHVHKVAKLLTVLEIRSVGFEELDHAVLLYLIKGMKDHTGHTSFMIFIGAIYIEELEPRPKRGRRTLLQSPFVEFVLGNAISIQRFQLTNHIMPVVIAFFTCTIGSRRRGIYKGHRI